MSKLSCKGRLVKTRRQWQQGRWLPKIPPHQHLHQIQIPEAETPPMAAAVPVTHRGESVGWHPRLVISVPTHSATTLLPWPCLNSVFISLLIFTPGRRTALPRSNLPPPKAHSKHHHHERKTIPKPADAAAHQGDSFRIAPTWPSYAEAALTLLIT